jgi:hypothetical protein
LYRRREALLSFADGYVVHRPEGNRPVVVVEGCGGSGRTSMLEVVAKEHKDAVALARVDARQAVGLSRHGEVSGLLLLAAYGLSNVPRGMPRPHFHRLFVAHTALAQEIDLATGPDNVGREMRAALARYRSQGQALQLAGQLLTGAGVAVLGQLKGVPPLEGLADSIKAASSAAVAALDQSPWWQRRWLPDATRWLGGEDEGREGDPVLAMIELNTWRQTGQENQIDRRLVSAFRGDLRTGLPRRRAYDCELLLDNADNPAARSFLRHLVAERQLPGARPDPLVVFAGSGGGLMAAPRPPEQHVHRCDEAGLRKLPEPPPPDLAWIRVRLGPLSAADVYALIPSGPDFAGVDDEWLARIVMANTGGHPGAVRLFVDALLRHPDLLADVDDLLATRAADRTLAEEILHEIVLGTDPDNQPTDGYLATLTTLAAARHADEADRMVAGGRLRAATDHDIEVLQAETLWPPPRPGEPGRLLPVARYLLLHALGRRAPEDPGSWVNLFGWLSDNTPADDPVGGLHHRFATGEKVGADLGAQLNTVSATVWLDRVDKIVATPDLRPRGARPKTDDFGVGEDVPGMIDQLLVAHRELNDPRLTHTGRFRARCLQIADLYLQLSRKVSRNAREFRERAAWYRALADTYQ